jgi:hypothetical protein
MLRIVLKVNLLLLLMLAAFHFRDSLNSGLDSAQMAVADCYNSACYSLSFTLHSAYYIVANRIPSTKLFGSKLPGELVDSFAAVTFAAYSSAISVADNLYFGNRLLKERLSQEFILLADPALDTLQQDTERRMRLAAVEAYSSRSGDMGVVGDAVVRESKAGMQRVYVELHGLRKKLLSNTTILETIAASRYNARYKTGSGIAPQTWMVVKDAIFLQRNRCVSRMKQATDKVLAILGERGEVVDELLKKLPPPVITKEPSFEERAALLCAQLMAMFGV